MRRPTPAAQAAAAAAAQINSKLGASTTVSDPGATFGVPQTENITVPDRFVGLCKFNRVCFTKVGVLLIVFCI